MYLKRLEMVGFKSFAERTRLEFEPGITAIVGPNGCGKSNVVDALRWCLGEMSPKSLRSKVLLDVIFNGSANRVPSNLSEVSLTFDNANHRLPIDFTEVTITRRLFRSGESEYFMNKTQCRLKDIRELFLDTGIGEEGYSIMEQGRVDFILSARPEERRELFEEAAGVSKYKARREEALRKMDRTQLDLDRLSDVIAMTKEQMDKIDAQVRKARLYQKAQDDLKRTEISYWVWEASQLEEQIGSMRNALQMIENDLQQKNTDVAKWEASLTDLRWQETQIGERLVELNRRLSEVDGAIAMAEQKGTTAREREEEIRHRDFVLDAELSQARARRGDLERMRSEVKGTLEAEAGQARESAESLQAADQVHRERAEALKELEAQAKSLQDDLWKKNQERTRLHNDISAQKSLEGRLETQQASLEKEKAKVQEKSQSQSGALAEGEDEARRLVEETASLELKAAEAKDAVASVEGRLAELAKLLTGAQNAVYRLKAQLDAQDEYEASDVYAQGVQAILAARLPGIHGPFGKLIAVSAVDEGPVRRALGSHVNDLVAETLDQARAAVDHLASQGKGRARFIVLDRLPSGGRPSAGASMGGHRAVMDLVRTEDAFRPAVDFLLGGWLAQGNALYGEGLLEGGAETASVPAFDSLRRGNIHKELDMHSADLDKLTAEKQQKESERKALSQEFESARHALESAKAKANYFSQEMDRRRSGLDLLREELRLIESEMEKASAARAGAAETARSLEGRLEAMSADEESLRARWTEVQETLQARQSETLSASSALAVAKERASSHEERLKWKEQQLADIEAELSSIAQALEAKTQEREGSAVRIEEQKRVQTESKAVIGERLLERKAAAEELEMVHAERQGLHAKLTEATNALSDIREQHDEMQQQLQEKKLQQSHAEFKRENIETQLREKYGLPLAEARGGADAPLPASPPALSELERLRRRVEGMGPVNLAAPEEHAQLEERYNFLLSQQQDLVKAKEDLLKTIQHINSSTRLQFKETFDKVRENFRALYGKLFPGGEADIRLTDENDLQNTGVEIFAQPPGKKLQNLALLSGGEKALTAVALLFAFFMVRPAPFCVLDEVDAPLDEANVTRFVSLLKTFTAQSQFLMITHNKRSMETADTLYGVTMETLGVSRVLSARLKQDGERRGTESPETVIAGN
jgi:chromosome segregation protein